VTEKFKRGYIGIISRFLNISHKDVNIQGIHLLILEEKPFLARLMNYKDKKNGET
jgi:hypothetical protein